MHNQTRSGKRTAIRPGVETILEISACLDMMLLNSCSVFLGYH